MIKGPVHTIEIPTADDQPVRGDLYVPTTGDATGLVVLCHGFKGYKTWGFFPYVAGRIRDAGLAALSIDFSFNGTFPAKRVTGGASLDGGTPGTPDAHNHTIYQRPDLFRINTLKREREDLASVMRFIDGQKLDAYLMPPVPVGLFGHSRGGVVAYLHTIEEHNIEALCTWSIPDNADIFDARQIERWRREGEYNFTNAVDGTRLSVATRFLDDLEANHDLYDLRRQAPRLRTPHLIVHGEMDLAIDVERARVLYEAEKNLDDKHLLVVRTGHLFGIPYPPPEDSPDGPAAALVEATDATVNWFLTYLVKGA